jgi:hypothetical protein
LRHHRWPCSGPRHSRSTANSSTRRSRSPDDACRHSYPAQALARSTPGSVTAASSAPTATKSERPNSEGPVEAPLVPLSPTARRKTIEIFPQYSLVRLSAATLLLWLGYVCGHHLRRRRSDFHDGHVRPRTRDRRFVLAFALGCALSSSYGFVSGAWPFGVVEAIWCLIAIHRYYRAPAPKPDPKAA